MATKAKSSSAAAPALSTKVLPSANWSRAMALGPGVLAENIGDRRLMDSASSGKNK